MTQFLARPGGGKLFDSRARTVSKIERGGGGAEQRDGAYVRTKINDMYVM